MTRSKMALRFAPALGAMSLALGAAFGVCAQAPMLDLPGPAMPKTPNSPFTVYPVRGHIYMITGAGGNTTVSAGPDGVMVVDPKSAAVTGPLLAEIRRISDAEIRYVLDTNGDPDHMGGNAAIAKTGETIQGGNTRPSVAYGSGGAPIWAHEGVLNRLTAAGGEPVGWPTDTYFQGQKDMFVNGEAVQMMHADGHTDGDSLIMFRRSDVISAGDIYTPDRYPVIDLEHGGSINGLIDGLNLLLRLTVPQFNEEGGTLVIPGHGRISDEADVSEYRDMVTIVRDRVRDMIKRKMTLEQVKAAQPTFEYDPLYGADKGAVFVEQVYRSLQKPATRRPS